MTYQNCANMGGGLRDGGDGGGIKPQKADLFTLAHALCGQLKAK